MKSELVQIFSHDILYFPKIGSGVTSVWRRNLLHFKQNILFGSMWSVIEPIFYLLAFGFGLGAFVTQVDGMPYRFFLVPGMVVIAGLVVSFYETTYGSYSKLATHQTFQTILLTPVTASEVGLGEILWATTKGFLSSSFLLLFCWGFGLIRGMEVVYAMGFSFYLCWIFAAMGLLVTSYAKDFSVFTHFHSAIIAPMTLFCGTFFPLENLPLFFNWLAYGLPVTHGVMAMRMILLGDFQPIFFINIGVLFLFGVILTNWAVARIERRIVL